MKRSTVRRFEQLLSQIQGRTDTPRGEVMAIVERQQIAEIIDMADVAVRAASQLRILRRGRALRDNNAMQRMIRFLDDAISGGQFMSTGQAVGLHASLRPLNWVADVRFPTSTAIAASHENAPDYVALVEFVGSIKHTLAQISDGQSADPQKLESAIQFLQTLGDVLGAKADQRMRHVSGVVSGPMATVC